ncbi:preprotein translocase subunit SecY, partial [Ruminococcus sp.]|uniref:preprotein translocase subunit SecY n=1 Tax=Ruminococcus sp. TaxID=41978 RepID=UPI00386976AE
IRKKMLLTLLMLLIFRLGCFIPVPGIASGSFQSLASNDFFSIMSTITGGSLQNGTLFALGIIPFINAFIIMQLLTLVIPPLDRLSKQGEDGRKKITQITRYMAIVLAVIQGVGICLGWGKGMFDATFGSTALSMALVIIMFVGGSCLVMWIGDRITEYGVGNGTSLIIFVGILASAGQSLVSAFKNVGNGDVAKNVWLIIAFLVVVLFVFVFIIFVDLAERKITIQYAKQVKGNKMYGGQSTHIPMKVNASGVMPIIFASSFLMFPQMIASFWPTSAFYQWWAKWLGIGTPIYIAVMCLLILFFSFFYSQIQFNPEEISKNIQQNGGYIPGIRPGRPTAEFLKKINNRITLFGAIFLAIIALIPSVVFKFIGQENGLANSFSATGLLIVVSVAMEFDTQLQNQLMMKHYKGFLK